MQHKMSEDFRPRHPPLSDIIFGADDIAPRTQTVRFFTSSSIPESSDSNPAPSTAPRSTSNPEPSHKGPEEHRYSVVAKTKPAVAPPEFDRSLPNTHSFYSIREGEGRSPDASSIFTQDSNTNNHTLPFTEPEEIMKKVSFGGLLLRFASTEDRIALAASACFAFMGGALIPFMPVRSRTLPQTPSLDTH